MSSLQNVYSGIEIVEIQRLVELNQPIDEISSLVRKVEGCVTDITSLLARYSASNMDQQYFFAVRSTITMCSELNKSSEELFQCQFAIANLMQKLAVYEEISIDISPFSLIEFSFPKINVNSNTTIFVKQEMIYVYDSIGTFCNQIAEDIVKMRIIPESASGWRDDQKIALQDFINEFTGTLIKGCQVLVDYQNHLGKQIQGV